MKNLLMKNRLLTAGTMAVLLMAGCGDKEDEASREGGGDPPPPARGSGGSGNPGLPAPAVPKPDTVESLAEEVGLQFDNFARALEGAKTSSSADKLTEIVPLVSWQIKAIATRLSKLEEPSDAVKEEISNRMKKREKEMETTFGSLEQFMDGLSPSVKAEVEDALGAFLGAMTEVEEVFSKYFDVEESADPPIPPPDPLDLPDPDAPEEPTDPGVPADAPEPAGDPEPNGTPE
jgi:hypothetical protein